MQAGFSLLALESVGSTSDEAKRLARQGAAHGTVVWAREQTAGRGRAGRNWASPPGNLYLSIILRPGLAPAAMPELGFVAAVALAEAVVQCTGLEPQCKWPNDLLIDGAKTAGLLLETETAGDGRVDWAVLGIGVNVESHPTDTPYPATDLAAAAGRKVDLRGLLDAVLARLAIRFAAWQRDGFAAIRSAWIARARGIGERIVVRLPQSEVSGRFIDLDPQGRLVLALDDGAQRSISAGEVFFGR